MSDNHQYTPGDIADLRERVDIYRALVAAVNRWPEVARLVFDASTPGLLIEQLRALLDVSEVGARSVTEMQLSRIPVDERAKILHQLESSEAELARALAQGDD